MNLSRHGTIFPGADNPPRPFLPQVWAHRPAEGDAGGRARGSPATRLYPRACPGTPRALLEGLVPASQHTNPPRTPTALAPAEGRRPGGPRTPPLLPPPPASPAAPPLAGRGGRHLAGRRYHLSAGWGGGGSPREAGTCYAAAARPRPCSPHPPTPPPASSGGAFGMSPVFPGPISPPCA